MIGLVGVAYLWVLVVVCKFTSVSKKPIPTPEKKSWQDTE